MHIPLEGHTVFDFFKTPRNRAPVAEEADQGNRSTQRPQIAASNAAGQPVSSRDLIRVVLRDTLRKNGIPTDWIGVQIATRPQAGQSSTHQIQLVILKWHEGLLRFAPLLQQQILQGLRQFDAQSDHSGDTLVWTFAADCGCPYTAMPAPNYWEAAAEKQKFDLPPTSRKFHEVDDDFATTVPSPLP